MAVWRSWRDYYGRVVKRVARIVFRAGRGQVIGSLLAVVTTLLQWKYDLIPLEQITPAALSLFWPFAAWFAALLLAGAVSAPVELDMERAKAEATLRQEIAERDSRIVSLTAERVSPAEQKRRAEVADVIKQMTPGAVDLLRKIVRAGKWNRDELTTTAFPDGGEVLSICEQRYRFLESVRFCRRDRPTLQPAEAYRSALEFCLFQDTSAG